MFVAWPMSPRFLHSIKLWGACMPTQHTCAAHKDSLSAEDSLTALPCTTR